VLTAPGVPSCSGAVLFRGTYTVRQAF